VHERALATMASPPHGQVPNLCGIFAPGAHKDALERPDSLSQNARSEVRSVA
jgi:hypothetical protein